MCCCAEVTGEGSQVHRKERGCPQPGAVAAGRCWEGKGDAALAVRCVTHSWGRGLTLPLLTAPWKQTLTSAARPFLWTCALLDSLGWPKQAGEARGYPFCHNPVKTAHTVTLDRGVVASLLFFSSFTSNN